ncbi:serine hydrolase domain-containing protein [Mariniluteicoccus flavus]
MVLDQAYAALRDGCRDGATPAWPGAVLLVRRPGRPDEAAVAGVRDLATGEPMTPDTVFDLASVTKVVTAFVALSVADASGRDLDEPLGAVLPPWRDGVRGTVTPRHLLTHTSGLPPTLRVHDLPATQRHRTVLAAPLEAEPGTRFAYSCVGFQTLGFWCEAVTRTPLPDLVRGLVTEPLGLEHLGFNPRQRGERRPIAPTEQMSDPPRGMVRGEVHDEAAWALGGAVGNAGLFAPADELAAFGELLLADGPVPRAMRTPQLSPELEAQAGFQQGLGVRIGQRTLTGPSPTAFGHGGFTGTALVVSPEDQAVVVLLSNRVHPSRETGDIAPQRQKVVDGALGFDSAAGGLAQPT